MCRKQSATINDEGVALWARGDVRGAIQKYREALKLDPNNVVIRSNLALAEAFLLVEKSDYSGAVQILKDAVALRPKNRVLRASLLHAEGTALAANGNHRSAIRKFEEALKFAGDDAQHLKGDIRAAKIALVQQQAAASEQAELDRNLGAWTLQKQRQVREVVDKDERWPNEVLSSIRQGRVPELTYAPYSFSELRSGDILLVAPEKFDVLGQLIRIGDLLKRTAVEFASAETYREAIGAIISTERQPVSHAVFVFSAADGVPLILDHRIEGSRILTLDDFKRKYKDRALFAARPLSRPVGIKLEEAAVSAALNNVSDYGFFGDKKVVCSERSGFAVATAAGIELKRENILPVDITPGDFFDANAVGKHFIVSPFDMKKGIAKRRAYQ